MTHKEKVKLARRLKTREELKTKGKGIFMSSAWESRKQAIKERVRKHDTGQ